MAQEAGKTPAEVKAPLTPEQVFEVTTKIVGDRARDITKAVRLYRAEESDIEEVVLEVQLGQRKLQKAMVAMGAAHKALAAK